MARLIYLISGVLFGAGMVISGMVNPNKVIAFLDITGNWDPSLLFVMGGALLVFTPCYHFIIKKRVTSINGTTFNFANNKKIDKKLLSGAAIFGIGWGLAGFCPGPVISSVASMSPVILVFIICMIAGMVLVDLFSTKK